MLKKLENLPEGILGIRAEGTITRSDYEKVLVPLLEAAHKEKRQIYFLYQFASDFDRFTAAAAMEDFRVGLKYLSLFQKCAILADGEWIRKASHLMGLFIPCPVEVFKADELDTACNWLLTPHESTLQFNLSDDGVLLVRPQGPLETADFDKLASVVDPWVKEHKNLKGLVINVEKFPGWENLDGLVHHLEFVKDHHKNVKRIALAVDGLLPEMASQAANRFSQHEVRKFDFTNVDEALKWVRS